jgi:hypothetical protein
MRSSIEAFRSVDGNLSLYERKSRDFDFPYLCFTYPETSSKARFTEVAGLGDFRDSLKVAFRHRRVLSVWFGKHGDSMQLSLQNSARRVLGSWNVKAGSTVLFVDFNSYHLWNRLISAISTSNSSACVSMATLYRCDQTTLRPVSSEWVAGSLVLKGDVAIDWSP